MALFKEDLDHLKCPCGRPGCEDKMILHSKCHPREPTWVDYFNGEITVRCARCNQVIGVIAVAAKEGRGAPC